MKEPRLPRKVKVGKRWYSVEILEAMANKSEMGKVNFEDRTIKLGRRTHHNVAFDPADIKESFWHELVHAILHDMGEHQLNKRETFVEEFAQRLTQAITSARF